MAIKNLLILTGAAMGHTILTRDTKFSCGAPEPSLQHRADAAGFAIQESAARASGFATQAAIDIDVYFHAVSAQEKTLVSEAKLKEQFEVLRKQYEPHGVTMKLAGTSKTVDAGWATNSDEVAMKKKLRKGTYKDLNMYFQDKVNTEIGDVLGYCYFPTDAAPGSEDYIKDGCNIVATSVPGGKAPFDLGMTAVHEAGHWFGLFHTFQGGCANGDEVADTPAQESYSSGCPKGRDSCPDSEGKDPIHNFMDYSDDACYEEFTKGQIDRLNSFWTKYRANAQ